MKTIKIIIITLVLFSTVRIWAASPQMKTLSPPPNAPDFQLLDLDDIEHTLTTHEGKILIINFWATWCPPCRKEMPSMQRAWEKVKDQNVVLLGINVGEDADSVFAFGAEYDVTFPLLLDVDSNATKKWPIRGLPTTYVVDTNKKIIFEAIGGREWDDSTLLDQILALDEQ